MTPQGRTESQAGRAEPGPFCSSLGRKALAFAVPFFNLKPAIRAATNLASVPNKALKAVAAPGALSVAAGRKGGRVSTEHVCLRPPSA